ncbi:MAG: hypothetical protein V3W41_01600 [Planctomycetota bacterium]
MTTTIIHPQTSGRGQGRKQTTDFTRTTQRAIAGGYRPISTHELAIVAWLRSSGHISRRQQRIYFAAHEMAARREAAKACSGAYGDAPEPLFLLQELKALVGGRGSKSANRDLSADVKQLRELGLVAITAHEITFASSIEQIVIADDLEGFWAFFSALPRPKGKVPVPRRTLRALAAGFRPAETAFIIAALIRSVFWSKKTGLYTTDGRTRCSWVAQTFGFDLATIRAARRHLIELGWLKPVETPQWALNKWGSHDVINVDWAPAKPDAAANDAVENSDPDAVGEGRGSGQSHTPPAKNSGQSHTPSKQISPSTKELKTRRLRANALNRSGVCTKEGRPEGPRRRTSHRKGSTRPNIRDVTAEDLKSPEALLELWPQALELGFTFEGESGKLDFLALANRARSNGSNPPALFFNLISKHRRAFITIADEETARTQLRELRDGPTTRSRDGGGSFRPERQNAMPDYTEDETIVLRCQKACPGRTPQELFRGARRHLPEGWTLERWESAHISLCQKDARRWAQDEDYQPNSDLVPMG